MIDALLGIKLAAWLGITNIITLILVLTTCRCMFGTIVGRLWERPWYQKYYKLHCYFWILFIISVLSHAIFAIMSYGLTL